MNLLSLILVHFIAAAERPSNAVEIVRPESYSIRRFQEVIKDATPPEGLSPQEELISLRAQWIISKQRLQDLKTKHAQQQITPPANEATLVKDVHLKAAQAQIDHYAKLIERNESKILREKRQQRGQSSRKHKSSK